MGAVVASATGSPFPHSAEVTPDELRLSYGIAEKFAPCKADKCVGTSLPASHKA